MDKRGVYYKTIIQWKKRTTKKILYYSISITFTFFQGIYFWRYQYKFWVNEKINKKSPKNLKIWVLKNIYISEFCCSEVSGLFFLLIFWQLSMKYFLWKMLLKHYAQIFVQSAELKLLEMYCILYKKVLLYKI